MQMNIQAVVIGSRDIDEEDRLLTLLTKEQGVLRAYAKGANRLRSRLAPSTGLLCYSSFVLFHHKERYTVDHADGIEMFFGLRQDIEKLSLATYFAELSAVLSPAGQPAGEQLRLLLNTLHLLEKGKRAPGFLKPVFELRAVTLGGYMPDLVACCGCGSFQEPRMFFTLDSGQLICGGCIEKQGRGQHAGCVELSPGVLAAMRHILYSPFERLFSFQLPNQGLALLGTVAERYLIRQTERNYQTLDFYKSIL